MKNWFWVPVAAVVGLVAGSWGPREDLKTFKDRVSLAHTTRKTSEAAGFDAFAHLVNIPDIAKHRKATEPSKPQVDSNKTNALPVVRRQRISPKDLRARIDEAADLWRTRVELATVQWKDKLGVSSGEQGSAFDSAIATMNESLHEVMQVVADELENGGEMTPELGLRLMGDASRVMAETYDAIGSSLPEDRRKAISELPVFEFIDPAVAEPLIGVQDKLDAGFGRRDR